MTTDRMEWTPAKGILVDQCIVIMEMDKLLLELFHLVQVKAVVLQDFLAFTLVRLPI